MNSKHILLTLFFGSKQAKPNNIKETPFFIKHQIKKTNVTWLEGQNLEAVIIYIWDITTNRSSHFKKQMFDPNFTGSNLISHDTSKTAVQAMHFEEAA